MSSNLTSTVPTSADDIPMAVPSITKPQGKTLYDLAAEREAVLSNLAPFDKLHKDGRIRDENGNILKFKSATPTPSQTPQTTYDHILDALLLTLTMSMLHFTLDILVYNQYRQSIEWLPIAKRSATLFPILFMLIYTLNSRLAARFPFARQVLFFAMAIGAGCYMLHIGNTYDYYAVMKQAPPVGTVWIWSVYEMRLGFAVTSLGINAAYAFYRGYTVF